MEATVTLNRIIGRHGDPVWEILVDGNRVGNPDPASGYSTERRAARDLFDALTDKVEKTGHNPNLETYDEAIHYDNRRA